MKLSRKKVVEINLTVVLSLLISMALAQDSNDFRPDPGSDSDAGAGTSRITSQPIGTTAGQSRRTGAIPSMIAWNYENISLPIQAKCFLMLCLYPRK
ncbi:MAG: hypothetical protein P8Z37_06110 [Acidobacteriota bacterium]|jgi:hypothetical protein